MDFIAKSNDLKKLTFKSPEWVAAYMSLVKDVYKMDKLYVILNPKKIDYDFEVGIPYVTKQHDTVMSLLFSDREHADAWINKYGNGNNFVGIIENKDFDDFFAKSVLFKINVTSINEGPDVFAMGNADMINMNNIPTNIQLPIPEELRGKENITLKDLNIDLPEFPIDGELSANDVVEHMQIQEHIDIEVIALMKDDDVFIDGKVHIFLNSESVKKWHEKHKDVAGEYKFVEDTVGMLAFNAIKREGSKGLIIDGLAPFQLFASKKELDKISDAVCAFTVFSAKSKGKINGSQAKEMLYGEQFYVCIDDDESGCGFDSMVRESKDGSFNAVQLYLSEESADKFNMKEHEIKRMKLSDIISSSKGYGLIFEPYSHFWIEIKPEELQ